MDDQSSHQTAAMSEPPSKSFDAVPVSPSHTDESGYYSPRGSSSCPPKARFFPCTSDTDFGLDMSDEEDDVFDDPDFAHMTPMANEGSTSRSSHSQPEVDIDLQSTVAVFSKSPLGVIRFRARSVSSYSYALTGPSVIICRRPLYPTSLSLSWKNLRPQLRFELDTPSIKLEAQEGNFLDGDDIDGEVAQRGSPPQNDVPFLPMPDDEPYSDDGASSATSHSPNMFDDDGTGWALPDIITSGTPRRRKRTLSEADATRMKKLEYRIACRLAQIGDEFDQQMFRNMDAVDGGGSGLLAWIGSSSSAMVTQFWHLITHQRGTPPFGLSRQRSYSTAD